MTVVGSDVDDQPTTEQTEIADVVRRVLADFTVPAADVPLTIAGLTLGRPIIAGPLAARTELTHLRHTVDTLRMRHRPVPIRPDTPDHLVCAATRKEFPCDDCAVLYEVRP